MIIVILLLSKSVTAISQNKTDCITYFVKAVFLKINQQSLLPIITSTLNQFTMQITLSLTELKF